MLEADLAALLEHTGDAAYVVTGSGMIRSWNRAAERLFGHARDAVIGRDVDDVLDARDALGTCALGGGEEAAVRRVDADTRLRDFDIEVRTASGTRIWVNVSTIVVEQRGRQGPLIVRLARDITARRAKEALVGRMVTAAREVASLADHPDGHAPVELLSEQERRILTLFAHGNPAEAVIRELHITAQTLRNHLHRINRKLRTRTRLQAVTHAQRRGLIV